MGELVGLGVGGFTGWERIALPQFENPPPPASSFATHSSTEFGSSNQSCTGGASGSMLKHPTSTHPAGPCLEVREVDFCKIGCEQKRQVMG